MSGPKTDTESDDATDQHEPSDNACVGFPPIPESAVNGIEFCLWSLEKAGVTFKHGRTAAYWNLVSVLGRHIK